MPDRQNNSKAISQLEKDLKLFDSLLEDLPAQVGRIIGVSRRDRRRLRATAERLALEVERRLLPQYHP